MTDQRPIDPSTLRDGEFQAGWDACLSAIKEQFGEDYSSTNRNPEWHVKMPDPVCPFPMGARVVDPFGAVEIVTDWRPTPGGLWLVYLGGRAAPYGWLPDALTLAPEPAPIEVVDWWQHSDGGVYVVRAISGGEAHLRRIDRRSANAVGLREMRDGFHWTRLDGPPEPPEGSVYVLTSFVCENIAGHHYRMGISGCHPWSEFLRCFTRQELATLQIVHTLGVE